MAKKDKSKKQIRERYEGNEKCPPWLSALMLGAARAMFDMNDIALMLGVSRTMLYFIHCGTEKGGEQLIKRATALTEMLNEKFSANVLPIPLNKTGRHAKMLAIINSLKFNISKIKVAKPSVVKPIPAKKVKRTDKAAKKVVKKTVKPASPPVTTPVKAAKTAKPKPVKAAKTAKTAKPKPVKAAKTAKTAKPKPVKVEPVKATPEPAKTSVKPVKAAKKAAKTAKPKPEDNKAVAGFFAHTAAMTGSDVKPFVADESNE